MKPHRIDYQIRGETYVFLFDDKNAHLVWLFANRLTRNQDLNFERRHVVRIKEAVDKYIERYGCKGK